MVTVNPCCHYHYHQQCRRERMAAQGSRRNGILMFRVEIHSPCFSLSFMDTTAVFGDVFTGVNTVLLLVCAHGLERMKKIP